MTGVELLVGGWFASPVIRTVIEKAHKYLSANFQLCKDAQDLIETLTDKLVICEAAVTEVERKPIINNPALANWLRRLKLAVYDAEDVLDNKEAKSIKKQVQEKNKVTELFSTLFSRTKNTLFLDDDLKSLKKVVDQLQQHSAEITNLVNLTNMNGNYESHNQEFTQQRETISQPLEEVGLYGREVELNSILGMMGDGNSQSTKKKWPKFILISGMGGVGKTALAQAVFNNPDIQLTFASKAWISVSSNLEVVQLTHKIFMSLGGYILSGESIPPLQSISLEDISQKLSSFIRGRRFLVVLDGMPIKDENGWDILYKSLSLGAPGSVVLVTTQHQPFANKVAVVASMHLALDPLEPATFWELFKRFAFENKTLSGMDIQIFESIGKMIAEKLHGLPLAAKIIGKLLCFKFDEDRWRRISRSEWWDIPEGRSGILASVALCYEYLDSHKRQCFAYCSLFPRNSLVDKDRLVQMWIAQNYVTLANQDDRLEDVGREWFDELVEMSFFQPVCDYNSSWDNNSPFYQPAKCNNKSYIMPNLMHDLAIAVSSGECFYLSDQVTIPQGVRHIAVDTKNLDMIQKIQRLKHLRSFLFFGFCVKGMYETINKTLRKLQNLRVLDLSYLSMEKTPPLAIQSSAHLRFLDLSYTGIEVLTHNGSLNHYHLQTLHVQGCKLQKFPIDMTKLINLRHLNYDVGTVAQISHIGQLTSLQEINEYIVDKGERYKITELKNLREITGHLLIKNCGNIKSKNEAMEANLDDKKHLDSIELSFCDWRELTEPNMDMEILEGLKPGNDIKELIISNYRGWSFPESWLKIFNLQNLRNLSLQSCPRIGALPLSENLVPFLSSLIIKDNCLLGAVPLDLVEASLRTLKIIESPIRSLENYPSSATCLTSLEIVKVQVNISLNIENLRLLEHLVLKYCLDLSIQGDLQSLTNLKRLTVIGCKPLRNSIHCIASKRKVKGEGLQSLSLLQMDETLWGFREHLGRLPSLRVLIFRSWDHQIQFTEHASLWFQELTTLRELHFYGKGFEQLPSALFALSSLQEMKLKLWDSLRSLPVDGMPPNLLKLTLECHNSDLEKQCIPFIGEDWQHISHIPLIEVNNRIIRKFTSNEGDEFWKLKKGNEDWKHLDDHNVATIW